MATLALRRLLRARRLPTLLARITGRPISAGENRVRDVDAAVLGVDPDVVRPVEQLALIVVDEDLVTAIRTDLPQFAVHVRRGDEVALTIEVHAVCAARAFEEQGDLAGT